MKKKHSAYSQTWKNRIRTAATCAFAVTAFSALSLLASAADKPFIPQAGSIPASEGNYSLDTPFNEEGEGTAGSRYFRIPAIVTLENGDLVATADARWETTGDGGGLDTIASVSSDGGKTWYYSFPFYFPDSDGYSGKNNSNPKMSHATTIIDPGLIAGPDGTVYCFADVNPSGSTTLYKTIGTGTGYVTVEGKRYLAVTDNYSNVETEPKDDNLNTYPYYVGDFDENGYAKILKRQDGSETGYGVDEWYNLYTIENGTYVNNLTQKQLAQGENLPDAQLYNNTDIQQNIFYKDSQFHVYSIGYIWMITSKDGGRTWEHPKNINDQVKRRTDEHAILISPGKGIVTNDGTLVIGFYDHGGEENASLAYSSDGGETWKRTNDIPGASAGGWWSSENEIVELEDGTLRMFFRNGQNYICYADAVKDPGTGEYVMGAPVKTAETSFSGCNVTALSYSKKINGKQAILVACPTASGRTKGKIFTYLVEADKSMTLLNSFAVPQKKNTMFDYSCLTELQNGTIGLLWETSWNDIVYDNFHILDLCPDADITNTSVSLELAEGETYRRTYDGAYEITKQPDESVASLQAENITSVIPLHAHVSNTASSLSSFSANADSNAWLMDAEFTFTASGDYWQIKNAAKNLYLANDGADTFFRSTPMDMKVTDVLGQGTFRICRSNGERFVIFYPAEMDFNANTSYSSSSNFNYELTLLEKKTSVSDSDILPGYQKATSITSGKSYLITALWENRVIVLYPENGKASQTRLAATSPIPVSVKRLAITANGAGYTTAVADGIQYEIRVSGQYAELDASCQHGSTTVKGVIPATCENDGYTGDTVCDNCGGVVKAGTAIPALGHDWDDGVVTKNVTRTENGEKIYTCKHDSFHTRTEIIYSSAYAAFLDEYEDVVRLMEDAGLYTPESISALEKVFESGTKIEEDKGAARSEMYQSAAAMQTAKATLTKKTAETMQAELSAALDKADTAPSSKGGVSDDIWNTYIDACNAASKVSSSASADEVWALLKALQAAQKSLDEAKEALALTTAAAALTDAVKTADTLYNAGQGSYTTASWQAFVTAYKAAKNPAADADAAALQKLTKELQTAQSKLTKDINTTVRPGPLPQPEPSTDIKTGDSVTWKNMEFKVLDANKKTASLTKVKDRKKAKYTVPASVTINGVSCTVTQIGAKAFKGCSKMKQVVIGKNVTLIGKQAFQNCKKLSKVTLKGTALTTIQSGAFKKTASKVTVTMPKKLKKAKKNALLKKMKKAGMAKKSAAK